MPKIRYCVAMSLDGYIAGPNDEADWIVMDPDVNFAEIWAQFDTLLMGRRTYEAASARLGKSSMQGRKVAVVSRTLRSQNHPEITIISELNRNAIQTLRAQSRKDIWLFGGGQLSSHLLHLGEVDTVEVSVIPVMLGAGIPLLRPPTLQTKLKLTSHMVYRSGRVALAYEVHTR
jgi:dihydrofolate reductase